VVRRAATQVTLRRHESWPGRVAYPVPALAARRYCQTFFAWYNDEHRQGGLGLHTPADIHYGTAEAIRDKRAAVLTDAYQAHPERFIRKPREPPHLPAGSWINPPDQPQETTQ
jgi:putative transposase